MKLTGCCNGNGIEQAIELENGVLLGFHAQRGPVSGDVRFAAGYAGPEHGGTSALAGLL